ncbi:MAG: hypothetical protein Q4D58_09855 [Synergistaceae bacterium]|nr:hypothetical protein [Synergistaceae bacterium]
MTIESLMEFLVCGNDGLALWCADCAARIASPGRREGGVQVEADEMLCPCGFEVGERGCVRSADYAEVEEKAAELVEMINDLRSDMDEVV